jgi:hypothetical protein
VTRFESANALSLPLNESSNLLILILLFRFFSNLGQAKPSLGLSLIERLNPVVGGVVRPGRTVCRLRAVPLRVPLFHSGLAVQKVRRKA